MTNEEHTVEKNEIFNLRIELDPNMDVEKITNLIQKWINEKWLVEIEKGFISLSLRSLTELRQFLENEYSDTIFECNICSDIVNRGQSCSNIHCSVKLHHHCSRQWFQRGRTRKCPACTSPWPDAPLKWKDNSVPPLREPDNPNTIIIG